MTGTLVSIPVGVVVERRKAASQWIDFVWQAVGVLPGRPDAVPWTVLSSSDDRTTFYAGSADIALHRTETELYRNNLVSATPSLWILLRATDGEPPYRIAAVTADPAEGEGFTEAGDDLVEAVPMPEAVRETIAAFVAEHHVERPFVKRKLDRADPEALARPAPTEKDDK